MLAFFASDPEKQISLLPKLPQNKGVREFYLTYNQNLLLLFTDCFLEESWHHDYELWETFITRTGLASDFRFDKGALIELRCLMAMLKGQITKGDDSLWTQQGLQRKTEWKLVRRLAQIVIDELGWNNSIPVEQVNELVRKLTSTRRG